MSAAQVGAGLNPAGAPPRRGLMARSQEDGTTNVSSTVPMCRLPVTRIRMGVTIATPPDNFGGAASRCKNAFDHEIEQMGKIGSREKCRTLLLHLQTWDCEPAAG
ncbi:hypothetical protein GCM10010532_025280 [Dactylosporangium siamense]|uniref:Uncharacterized protein n=1 Tax=Dactylosporangium siamense TaxID=685454 RepID=A0A919UD35_9ACTN|nr:hypothetical protein Dsi01nite_091400 [Dactylosporangium siamense]